MPATLTEFMEDIEQRLSNYDSGTGYVVDGDITDEDIQMLTARHDDIIILGLNADDLARWRR